MKKIIDLIKKKSLTKSIFLSLSAVCLTISVFCYALYYYNTSHILENRLAEYTQSQLALNNNNFKKNFDTVELISDNLLNNLYQYDPVSPLNYITKLNQFSTLQDTETIEFVNYTIDTLDFYLENYPILDSILLYTKNGTVIASTGTYTKTQMLQSQCSDFIMDSIIPNFNPDLTTFLWLGGHDSSEFIAGSSQYDKHNQNPTYVFTGIRRLKPSYDSKDELFLVFNLKQEFIHDIYYTYPISSDGGSVFLIDSDGTIHFSNNTSLIGTKSPYSSKLTVRDQFISFTETINDQKFNIFYQALDNTDWFVLYEIPNVIYASDINSFKTLSVLLFAFTMCLLLISVFWLIIRKLKPIHDLTQATNYIGQGHLGYTIQIQENNEIGILAQHFNQMSLELKQIMIEKEQIEEQKRHQEIAALQAQINPHFILNTINTVKWMAIINHVPNISECLTSFGRILEPLLKQQIDFYTVQEEICYLQNYVNTMNYSYGNTIHMKLSVPEKFHKCKIPRFILQPLVENAILHGVNKSTNEVSINVIFSGDNDILRIIVCSCGTTISPNTLLAIQRSLISQSPITGSKTSSIGLTNITQRLRIFYDESYALWIENSSDCEVKVSVILPMEFSK